jgi:predicted GIY-YIG superfamily endonuclease
MKAGIYFLIKSKKIVYIGQTKRFPKRIYEHPDKEFDSYKFIYCKKEMLIHYEQRWIRFFRPKYNLKVGRKTGSTNADIIC